METLLFVSFPASKAIPEQQNPIHEILRLLLAALMAEAILVCFI